VYRAGLPGGPYTPAEYALIALPVVRPINGDPQVGDHPAVIAATRARDEARVAFDACGEVWLRTVADHQAAVVAMPSPA
jgi:hypothetical protein